ncbi:MAG: DUF4097 family beta strand repeat protein [Clostridiales bacterium]|nr:DUF4097 family beta strand repeat protein [Clostridiales bacterium]
MKSMVKAIIAGSCIIVLGVAILLVALGLNGWTFKAHFDTKEFNAEQENNKIIVENSVGSMKINYYDGEKVQILYPEAQNYNVDIVEKDGHVQVITPSPKWYEFSIWWANIPETVINLPKDIEFELELIVKAGSLRLLDGQYSKIRLTVHAGSLNASGVQCDTFKAEVNAGSMQIDSLICATSFRGEVNAGSLNAKYVACSDITAKVSAGSLTMTLKGNKSDYNISAYVSAGSSNISNQRGSTEKRIDTYVYAGSLNVFFTLGNH